MKNSFTKISLVILICLPVVITGCCINIDGWPRAEYEKTERFQAPLEPGSILALENDVGSITIAGVNVNECNVIATISVKAPTEEEAQELAEQIKIELDRDGNTLTVRTEKPRTKKRRSISISFDITVPEQTALELGCDVGKIRVSNITETIKAQTDVGGITCREISNDIDLKADVGTVKVVYSKEAPAACSITISTDVGGIELTTPPDFSATVYAETDVGSIKTDLPLTVRGRISKSLHGTIGAGEGELRLKTDVGSIRIRK
ncbi:MAG: DUF4097 domain-containing protein [Phycisphaerae bacterium]